MGSDILSIGRSGLFAAQVGLSTTGHNISNANVEGYSRQEVIQTAAQAQNFGYGFTGTGTQISAIKRYSDNFLNDQVRSAISGKAGFDAYNEQISQVDNLLADTTSGLSPALQDFFKGVQDLSSNPQSVASRQALLSNADSLAARFQGLNSRLEEIRSGVNSRIDANVTVINSYAQQIADLNDKISKFSTDPQHQPNDLIDQRDHVVAELNKQVKAAVIQSDNQQYTVSIGSGQPLVVGAKAFQLASTTSPTDPTRIEVGYVTGNKVTVLAENALTGGELGGLFDFRASTLDRAQNELGRVAIGLAYTFNAQHKLGQDTNGALGGDFFNVAAAVVGQDRNNASISTTQVTAAVSDPSKLTTSDYRMQYDGTNWTVTRLDDNKLTVIKPFPQNKPQTIDGVDFSVQGNAVTGDVFTVRPTAQGAANFRVLITDRNKVAAAAPIATSAPTTNSGVATISEGVVDKTYLNPGNALTAPFTLTYAAIDNSIGGFPADKNVTVTINGVSTTYGGGQNVPYQDGATYSTGGISFSFTGTPNDNDTFVVAPNTSGVGDNRNMRALGALQTANILDNGTATFQSSYAEMISFVGNKARETQVNGQAADSLLTQAQASQQNVSGVNLDEEATALLKYQQAYQAAGKVIKLASELFQTLLDAGL